MYCGYKYISVEMGRRWNAGAGATIYENKIIAPNGISGGFTDNLETGKLDVMIQFSGKYFDGQSVVDQWRLLLGLKHTFKVKCNRIDIAIDDPSYSLIPVDNMVEGCQNNENFGFRSFKTISSGECGKSLSVTNYFGSRNSGKIVRIYDHNEECHRFEAEFKRGYSQPIFDFISSIKREWFYDVQETSCNTNFDSEYKRFIEKSLGEKDICSNLENITNGLHPCKDGFDIILQRILSSIAVTAIDFRDKTGLKDTQRASRRDTVRCDYYQEFIENIGAEIKIKLKPVARTIEKTIAWMQRSVSKSLSIIKDSLGAVEYTNWHSEFISLGQSKQRISDLKVIELIKENKSIIRLYS